MKSLNYNATINSLLNIVFDNLLKICTPILKPFVHIIYNKYRQYKQYSIRKQNRIKRDLKRKVIILSTASILGIIIAFTASSFSTAVKAEDNEQLHKYYTFYTVEPGDSLWEIAETNYELGYSNHSDYIEDVMFINHLKDADDIICGDTLVIPYYSYEIK